MTKSVKIPHLITGSVQVPWQGFGLQAAALGTDALDVKGHPNAMPFKGTLLLVDQPSDKPPQGADGHRIMVPRDVVEKLLPTLPGMGVNFSANADSHAPQKKVGVVTAAWLDGNKVKVKGVIWSKDFPREAQEIKANSPRLGMSMELAEVWVEDKNSPIWTLTDFKFTGGAILLKNSAAYYRTTLAASAEKNKFYKTALRAAKAVMEGKFPEKGDGRMSKKARKDSGRGSREKQEKKLILQIAAATSAGVSANLKDTLEQLAGSVSQLTRTVKTLDAARRRKKAESSEPSDASDMSAAANPSEPSDASDMSAAANPSEPSEPSDDISAGVEPSDVGSSDPSDASSEPGDQNRNAMTKFKNHSRAHLHAAAEKKFIKKLDAQAVQIRELTASNEKLQKSLKKRNRVIDSMQAQIERFSETLNRKSVSPELSMILSKGNYSAGDLQASGQKLTVDQMDQLFNLAAKGGVQLGATERVMIKNQATQLGILDDGAIQR